MRLKIEAKYAGGIADQHKLPAYLGTDSLNGIARSLLIITNYVAEDRVRYRDYRYDGYDINLLAVRPGSFEAVYELIVSEPAIAVATGVTGSLVYDLIKTVFKRCVGQAGQPTIARLENERILKSGDIAALVDAIEPAIRRAHNVVGEGASNIAIVNGDNNVVTFNASTKRYVNTSQLSNDMKSKLFSIDNYSVNSRYGRAYDFELEKTVPYVVDRRADRRTIRTILGSHERYAMKQLGDELSSAIGLMYREIVAADGRVKKIVVYKARPEVGDL